MIKITKYDGYSVWSTRLDNGNILTVTELVESTYDQMKGMIDKINKENREREGVGGEPVEPCVNR